MDVTLPSGLVIKNVPEGTPKEVIKAKAIAAGLATEADFAMPKAAPDAEAMTDLASEVGPLESFLIGTGKGVTDVARGLGFAAPEDQATQAAMQALQEQRPYTAGAGEIVGQAAPFVPLGMGLGGLAAKAAPGIAGQVAAGTTTGAIEGGVLGNAQGGANAAVEGAATGAVIGGAAEALFPIVGRLAGSLYRKVRGNPPPANLITPDGQPTPALQEALAANNMTFDDLVADAQRVINEAPPGTDPRQIARAALFAQEDIPATRGELFPEKGFEQIAKEQRLLNSASDQYAEKFREFKLNQSEQIKKALMSLKGPDTTPEATGELIKDALTGRRKLLRTQKNELYKEALQAVDSADKLPVLLPNLETELLPDARTLRGLNRASKGAVDDIMATLVDYGLIPLSSGPTPDEIIPLSLQNFEEFNQILKGIARSDTSGATGFLVDRITSAVDDEIDNLADAAQGLRLNERVVEPLKQARQTVRQLKTEFNPKALAGQLIDLKKGSQEPVLHSSQIYDKITRSSTPVEQIRDLVQSLNRAGTAGTAARNDLQATVMLDLIDAGFGTKSRKINDQMVFNPIAFRNRLEKIGQNKLAAIFEGREPTLQRLKNIDKIAEALTPPAGAVPKGSADVILDLINRLGMLSITQTAPFATAFVDFLGRARGTNVDARALREALRTNPSLQESATYIYQTYPGLSNALKLGEAIGVSAALTDIPEPQDEAQP